MKNIIIIVAVVWVASALIGYYFWGDTKEKIEIAEANLEEYQAKYDSIQKTNDSLDTIVDSLNIRRTELRSKVDSLNGRIVKLEIEQEEDVIRIARLFEPAEIVEKVKATFPKFARAPMGIAELRHPTLGVPITSFQMPIQLVNSFIADRKEVENLLKQKDVFKKVNFTLEEVIGLQDSIVALKDQKILAYKEGLDYGIAKFEALTKDYISTLKNPPKVSLFPDKAAVWLAVAAGAAVTGYAVK